jgi:poly(hydroxyalkanoate) depolymerase family esterase
MGLLTQIRATTVACATASFAVFLTSTVQAAPLTGISAFGSNPGNLKMFTFVPDPLPTGAPLVVVAHGCMQSAQEIADLSGWNDLAQAHGFVVVYPQTSRENDSFAGCFRTWLPEHQERGKGEPLSVVQMIEWMLGHHELDPRRVFITGMSSGGHLTNVMLATYPDLFAAGAPQSSFPYKCALTLADVDPCCRGVITHTREAWGELARSGYLGYEGPRPRVSIWHGMEDNLLRAVNLDYQRDQWISALGVDADPDGVKWADGYAGILYTDARGKPVVETFAIPRLGHAVALDLRAASPKCGQAGPYADDVHICAAAWIGRWFGILP